MGGFAAAKNHRVLDSGRVSESVDLGIAPRPFGIHLCCAVLSIPLDRLLPYVIGKNIPICNHRTRQP